MLNMDIDMNRRRGLSPPTPSLSAQVEAILSGTTGFALDPTDLATLWQDSAKTTPVTAASQPVGAIRTKWGNTQFDFLQSTAGARPTWDGTRFLVPDGVDDFLQAAATAVLRNKPAAFMMLRIDGAVPYTNTNWLVHSSNSTANNRFSGGNVNGRPRLVMRSLDGEAGITNDAPGTDVLGPAGTNTVAWQVNLVDGAIEKFRNNVSIATATYTGTLGAFSDTNEAIINIFKATNAAYTTKPVGRAVVLPFIPTSGQRATIHDWLMEV